MSLIETGLLSETGRLETQVAEKPQKRSFRGFSGGAVGSSGPAQDFRKSLEASAESASDKVTSPCLSKEEGSLAREKLGRGQAMPVDVGLRSASALDPSLSDSPKAALPSGSDAPPASIADPSLAAKNDSGHCDEITLAGLKPPIKRDQGSQGKVAVAAISEVGKPKPHEIEQSAPDYIVVVVAAAVPSQVPQTLETLSVSSSPGGVKLETDRAAGPDQVGVSSGVGTRGLATQGDNSISKKLGRETKRPLPAIPDATAAHGEEIEQLAITTVHVKSSDKVDTTEDKGATIPTHGTSGSVVLSVGVLAHTLPPTMTVSSERANHSGSSENKASETPGAQPTELKTLVATSHVLEIGVGDGTRGWLRVRAEIGRTGEIAASVTTASAEAAERLHTELPALSAYLEKEQVGIASLVVNATTIRAGEQDAGMSFGANAGSSSHSESRSESRSIQNSEMNKQGPLVLASEDAKRAASLGLSLIGTPGSRYAVGSGGWLSVRV